MSNLAVTTNLLFFQAEKYYYQNHHTFDTSDCPRPHFCMGLVLSGEGVFTDCNSNEKIIIMPGDIIFVPMSSTYVVNWSGSPQISYISAHFIFDRQSIFSSRNHFKLQKIRLSDFDRIKRHFTDFYINFNGNQAAQLSALSHFYAVLSLVLPHLVIKQNTIADSRIARSTRYIEENYTNRITVEDLASTAGMSVSRYFPRFKEQLGVTPIEYVNQFRITRAIILLLDKATAIEQIGEMVGFESTAYFRRVFKKITGKSPREFRKTAIEL